VVTEGEETELSIKGFPKSGAAPVAEGAVEIRQIVGIVRLGWGWKLRGQRS
jgi:hypothetical protein